MKLYAFYRAEGWYPLELVDDADACANAECNQGTIRVTAEPEGRTVWLRGAWLGKAKKVIQ